MRHVRCQNGGCIHRKGSMSNDRGGNNNKPVSGEKDLGMGHESMPHGPDRGLPKKGPDLTTPKRAAGWKDCAGETRAGFGQRRCEAGKLSQDFARLLLPLDFVWACAFTPTRYRHNAMTSTADLFTIVDDRVGTRNAVRHRRKPTLTNGLLRVLQRCRCPLYCTHGTHD
jgi:hypothetical protein